METGIKQKIESIEKENGGSLKGITLEVLIVFGQRKRRFVMNDPCLKINPNGEFLCCEESSTLITNIREIRRIGMDAGL